MMVGIDIRVLMTPFRTGVGEYTHELLNAILAADRMNQYFLFYNSFTDVFKYLPVWQYDNVHVVKTKWPNKFFNASQTLFHRPKLDQLLAKQYDTIHIDYFFSPNINFTSLSKNSKHILTIHDLSFELYPQCYSWKRRLWHQILNPKQQCEEAERILVPSEHTKRDVVNVYGIDEKKVQVLRPGMKDGVANQELRSTNYERIRNKYNLPEKFFLFLGTVEPRKNILGILEAYELYRQKHKYPVSLIIAGPKGWKTRRIFSKIKKTAGAQYIGYVDPADKAALFSAATVFVYPSLYEGFGFPVLESFAAGTPVITSNRSSLPEVGSTGAVLVHPYDTAELARAMDMLAHSPQIREQYRTRGYEELKAYSWEMTAREWLAMLR